MNAELKSTGYRTATANKMLALGWRKLLTMLNQKLKGIIVEQTKNSQMFAIYRKFSS